MNRFITTLLLLITACGSGNAYIHTKGEVDRDTAEILRRADASVVAQEDRPQPTIDQLHGMLGRLDRFDQERHLRDVLVRCKSFHEDDIVCYSDVKDGVLVFGAAFHPGKLNSVTAMHRYNEQVLIPACILVLTLNKKHVITVLRTDSMLATHTDCGGTWKTRSYVDPKENNESL